MSLSHTIFLITTLILPFFVTGQGENTTRIAAGTFTNPVRGYDGSDPFIVYSGSYYYFMITTWKDVSLTRAKTLRGLITGETKVVYKGTDPNICCNVWAPGQYPKFEVGRMNADAPQRSMILMGRGTSISQQAKQQI